MAQPSAKPNVLEVTAANGGDEVVLMGIAVFDAGVPGTVNVGIFGLTVKPLNFDTVGAIQFPQDVNGLLVAPVPGAPGGADQSLVGPGGATGADTLTPDAAWAGTMAAAYSAPDVVNAITADLTYDGGAPPPGGGSVVKGLWRGVELIIFVSILFP